MNRTKPTVWPTVIGIIAIVFGALGALGGGCGMASGPITELMFKLLPQQSVQQAQFQVMREWQIWTMAFACIQLVTACVLLLGGIRLLKRRATSRRICLSWAFIKMAIVVVQSVAGFIMQQAQFQAMSQQGTPTIPANFQGMQQALAGAGIILGVLWGWALPIFFIVWFNRKKIVQEMAEWQMPTS